MVELQGSELTQRTEEQAQLGLGLERLLRGAVKVHGNIVVQAYLGSVYNKGKQQKNERNRGCGQSVGGVCEGQAFSERQESGSGLSFRFGREKHRIRSTIWART